MNTLYFTYALEVEKTASITQAAENLFMTQPTLSKAIKDLEANVGFAIFRRTSRGVIPTQKGQTFLNHARKIVAQLGQMEQDFQCGDGVEQIFSLAMSRGSDLSQAAAKFLGSFDNARDMELDIRETSSLGVIDAVAEGQAVLGILRCPLDAEAHFQEQLTQKGLQADLLRRGRYVVLLSQAHPLAAVPELDTQALRPYIEIALSDDPDSRAAEQLNRKRILVNDSALQQKLLRKNPLTYLWTAPLPRSLLAPHHLVQRSCPDSREYLDLLITRTGYHLTQLDRAFLEELTGQKNASVSPDQ